MSGESEFEMGKSHAEVAANARAPYVSIIGELLTALENLHDACEHWEDQDDPVLKAARAAIERAKGTATREFTVWVVWGSDETLAENHVEPSLYSFWSQAELNAFMRALQEIDGNCDLHEAFDSEEEANEKCGIKNEGE